MTTTTASTTTPSLKSSALFSELESALAEDPDLVKSVKGTFSFQITEKGKQVGKPFCISLSFYIVSSELWVLYFV